MGRLYVSSAERIYRIDGKRKVVVAGTGTRGHSGDGGPATAAQLGGAGGFDVDHDKAIAISEYDNWIRVVDPGGSISTVAGNGGTGTAGDGGPALEALLGHPHDVVWRRDGVLVIADSHNGLLRRVDAAGKISTFASGLGAPIDVVGRAGRRALRRGRAARRAARRSRRRDADGRRAPARRDRGHRRQRRERVRLAVERTTRREGPPAGRITAVVFR